MSDVRDRSVLVNQIGGVISEERAKTQERNNEDGMVPVGNLMGSPDPIRSGVGAQDCVSSC